MLCDENTRKGAEGGFNFDAGTPVKLKGFNKPVSVYRVLSQAAASEERPLKLVGRHCELDLLWSILSLKRHDPNARCTVWVSGPMGAGKTRVAGELAERAKAFHFDLHLAKNSSVQGTDNKSWIAVQQLVHSILLKRGRDYLTYLLSEAEMLIAPVLCRFKILPFWLQPTSASTKITEPKESFQAAFDLCVSILSKTAGQVNQGFLLEDIDYIDRVSWDIMQEVRNLNMQDH